MPVHHALHLHLQSEQMNCAIHGAAMHSLMARGSSSQNFIRLQSLTRPNGRVALSARSADVSSLIVTCTALAPPR